MHVATPAILTAAGLMALGLVAGLAIPAIGPSGQPLDPAARHGCPPPSQRFARLELLFGTRLKDGGTVGEADWQAFLDAEITPRFPDGLTVLAGFGQWRNGQGVIVREAARMLLVWYIPGPRTEADIAAIREAYKTRFAQESVLRVDGVGCVGF